MKRLLISLTALALLVALLGGKANNGDSNGNDNPPTTKPTAANANPKVLPPQSNPHGMSYGAWGDEWWQWALSFPVDSNPMLDTTGKFAAEGQVGEVWFLAGDQGGVVERTVTIPAGQTLFFPIVNYIWVNTPQFGDPEWSPEQEAVARELVGEQIDNVSSMSCEIDGRPLESLSTYRAPTPADGVFMVTLPENNIFGVPPDTYGPSVQDGIWVMVAPLSVGQHTIHFTTTIGNPPSFSLDVTYNVTVE